MLNSERPNRSGSASSIFPKITFYLVNGSVLVWFGSAEPKKSWFGRSLKNVSKFLNSTHLSLTIIKFFRFPLPFWSSSSFEYPRAAVQCLKRAPPQSTWCYVTTAWPCWRPSWMRVFACHLASWHFAHATYWKAESFSAFEVEQWTKFAGLEPQCGHCEDARFRAQLRTRHVNAPRWFGSRELAFKWNYILYFCTFLLIIRAHMCDIWYTKIIAPKAC